ncbi:MAG: hypothetical protein L0I67_10755, partial [Enterobacterales bacterium]|nr:hypothetical protein [Enterobacterales bacterium]
ISKALDNDAIGGFSLFKIEHIYSNMGGLVLLAAKSIYANNAKTMFIFFLYSMIERPWTTTKLKMC